MDYQNFIEREAERGEYEQRIERQDRFCPPNPQPVKPPVSDDVRADLNRLSVSIWLCVRALSDLHWRRGFEEVAAALERAKQKFRDEREAILKEVQHAKE